MYINELKLGDCSILWVMKLPVCAKYGKFPLEDDLVELEIEVQYQVDYMPHVVFNCCFLQ